MTDYRKIKKNFDSKIQRLSEKSLTGAGRGRSIKPGGIIRQAWKDGMDVVNYDYLNRATSHLPSHVQKFNFNNYYTLDLRIDTDKMLEVFQSSKGVYEDAFDKIYKSEKLERVMVDQLRNAYIGSMRDFQAKDVLKAHFKDQYPEEGDRIDREDADIRRGEGVGMSFNDSVEISDILHDVLVLEGLSDEDIAMANDMIKADNINKGSELEYTTNKGDKLQVVVVDIPKEFGGNMAPGNVAVKSYYGEKRFAVSLVRDGKSKFNLKVPKIPKKSKTDKEDYEDPDHKIWSLSIYEILTDKDIGKVMTRIYDDLAIISIYTGGGEEELALKKNIRMGEVDKDGFVSLIMDGLSSAIRGHVPQGVTIEEMMAGTFSRKAIAPEQGTFINRVKDPTSDKAFSFRSDNPLTLKRLHDIIMETFKYDSALAIPLPSLAEGLSKIELKDLVLYMTQDDFHKLEKGGEGFKKLYKGIIQHIANTAAIPDL